MMLEKNSSYNNAYVSHQTNCLDVRGQGSLEWNSQQ